MIERVYFVSAIIKNKGELKFHFHSQVHLRTWFPKLIPTESLVAGIKKEAVGIADDDDVILTSFNRIK
jgi:hypothetical protein